MTHPLFIAIGAQLLFTMSDLLARSQLAHRELTAASFLTPWFLTYFIVRQIAMIGQLYVLSQTDLGRSATVFGALSVVLANILSFFVLREQISPLAFVGASLAVVAILLVGAVR